MTRLTRFKEWLSKFRAQGFVPAWRKLLARCSPLAQQKRRRLQKSFAELDVVLAELQEVSQKLEAEFLVTATALRELDTRGCDFVKQGGHLVNVAIGRGGGGTAVFADAMQVIAPPLDFLNDSHVSTKKLLERLKADNERIAQLIRGRDDLQNTMAPLKYIQTSFKIEAAPLGEEVQLMFTALTQEIEKLHIQVVEIFTGKYEELQKVRDNISQVIVRLEVQTNAMCEKITKEKAQIDSSLHQLQTELQDNQKRESSIAGLSGQVANEIQQVVIGLQFQDIISQRLQHTMAALAKVKAQYDGSETSVDFMEQACRLEAQQIKSVREELARAEKSVRGGIENVLAQLVEADQRCVSLHEFENLTVSANGMVQVLLDVVAMLQKQTTATEAGCAAALDILRPIGSMASDLTQVVRGLSQRIHLIGLNAQVQAAQVPEGMGLEVLSARTSEISRETNRISQSIAEQLDHLVTGLAESLSALGNIHASAAIQKITLEDRGTTSEQHLHALRDAALASLTDVNALLENIRKQGGAVLATANYVATGDGALARLESHLDVVAKLAADQLGGRRTEDLNRITQLKESYTMASERNVFESTATRAINSSAAKSSEPSPAPVAVGADENGVELF